MHLLRWSSFLNCDRVISGVAGYIQGYSLYSYCFDNPVNMSDSEGNWPSVILLAVIFVATVVVPIVGNHVINKQNEKQIEKEIQKTYTKESAKEEIDELLNDYSVNNSKVEIEFYDTGVDISQSNRVNRRYDRQKVSMVVSRTEDFTNRQYSNISAEWLLHNIIFSLGISQYQQSAESAYLDYLRDPRDIVYYLTRVLEIFGAE